MKKYIMLAIIPLFISGTSATSGGFLTAPCDCADSIDTSLPDTLRAIAVQVVVNKVDSFKEAKLAQLDSLNSIKDSLALELQRLKNEKYKKLIIKERDTIPGWIWKWGYWQYPDGSIRFHKVYKTRYKP